MDGHSDKTRNLRSYTVIGILCCILAACALFVRPGGETSMEEAEASIETASLPTLVATEIHAGLNYSLDDAADKKIAPRVFVDSLSLDLNRIRDVDQKKATFFRILVPIVARENDRVRAERDKIIADPAEVPKSLYRKYDVEPGDVDTLMRRVDVVPASLVLAQAAIESGWGTSRFARKGNNYFGMRTYDEDTPGMDPHKADGFKVMTFKSISHSVRTYIKNLNSHSAYKTLRHARAKMRDGGGMPKGRSLTNFLTAYSEIPEEYGQRLRGMMDKNGLDKFDGIRLAAR